jgi:hypothetical protein
MNWKFEPTNEKQVIEFVTYVKDTHIIKYASYYKFGEAFVNSDSKPMFEYNETDGIDTQTLGEGVEHNLYNCYSSKIVEFSEHMKPHIRKKLSTFLKKNTTSELEETGWEYLDSEVWFYGPLQITNCYIVSPI